MQYLRSNSRPIRRSSIVLAAALVATLVPSLTATAVVTPSVYTGFAYSCGSGYYSADLCKYNRTKIIAEPNTSYTSHWYMRAGTASGTCDPTNNITKVEMSVQIWDQITGVNHSVPWGPYSYTNCDSATGTLRNATMQHYVGTYQAAFRSKFFWSPTCSSGCVGVDMQWKIVIA